MSNKKERTCFVLAVVSLLISFLAAQTDIRDRDHEPDKVMDIAGVVPGLVIGEVGAGEGYFTFKLAARVGDRGKVYANDIDSGALRTLLNRARRDGVANIETIVGEVEDPLLPEGALDMVFMVNVLHDLEKPVELLRNLVPSLKPGGRVVILDREPAKMAFNSRHFLPAETVLAKVKEAGFELVRMETFLRQHNLYIITPTSERPRAAIMHGARLPGS